MEYILIFISAIFVNNIILSQFLGICPFLGVSKKVDTSLGMSAAVAFVFRNHPQEGVARTLSSAGHLPATHHH